MASAHAPGQHCSKATLPKVALSRATRAWRLAPETKNTHPNLITRLISPPRPRAPRPPPACPCACAPPLPRRTRSTDHRAVHRARRATPTAHRPTERVATARPRGPRPPRRAVHGPRCARGTRAAHSALSPLYHSARYAHARDVAHVCPARPVGPRAFRVLRSVFVCVWRGVCRACVSSFQKKLHIRNNKKMPFSCFAIFFVSFMGDTAPPSPGPRHGARLVSRPRPRESRGGRRQWWPEPRGAPPLPPD